MISRPWVCQAGAVDPVELGTAAAIPDPALVVLVGPAGSGKSVWAAERYRADEVVSSDRLRALVGSGEHDLEASTDAFALLDQIVAARLRRGLTAVVDTLGLDSARRRGYRELARSNGMPAVVVLVDTIRRSAAAGTAHGISRCPRPRWRVSCGGCGRPSWRSAARAGMW